MKITLPYPPSANRYWRNYQGRVALSEEAQQYKRDVGLFCGARNMQPVIGDVQLVLNFYRPRKAGDLDNLLKVTLDALNGWAYVDDKQVVEINARRFEDKEYPRVEVVVTEVG